MKKVRVLKALAAVGVIAACGLGMFACSGGESAQGGVAATVNGTDIMEADVTQQVHTMRVQNQMDQEDSWGLYLAMTGQTPSDVRTSAIEALKNRIVKKAGAAELNIELDTAEVDKQLESVKANYGSDEKWQEALTNAGWTDEEYRAFVEDQVLTKQLGEYFQDKAEVSDETLLETANTYATSYYNGLKRSSNILFKVEDTSDEAAMKEAREKAQDVLDQINAGDISFEDAAKKYSDDTSKDDGGDVGWSNQGFVSEYLQAVDELNVGEVSGLVESQFGIHIIKVTDEYKAPEKVKSLKDLPEDFRDDIKSAASMSQAQTDYTEWLNGLSEAAEFTQNDMPSGLPYDVDMAKYQEKYEQMMAESQSQDSAGGEDATDETESEDVDGDGEVDEQAEGEAGEGAEGEASAEAETAEGEASDAPAEADASASSESAAE